MNSGASRRTTAKSTIRDVAKAAGVSVGTVSKVLNRTGSISPATKEKVHQAASRLRFRPNVLAQSLQSGTSRTVGLISNDSFGRFTMPIMEGLEDELAREGIGIFMCNATDDPEREQMHVDQLMAKQVDGIVVTARRSDRRPAVDLRGIDVPTIFVFSRPDDADALALLPDDEGGGYLATSHLAQTGRTRIMHVTGPEHFEAVRLRARGYRTALNDRGLHEFPTIHGDWSEAWGRAAVGQLLAGSEEPDAIFCGNDQIARGCADALREAGMDLPRDVALVGFDNWSVMTDACRPPLTSVDLNLVALGREAARRLVGMIDGSRQSGTVRVPCRLVARASSLPLQQG